MDRIRRRFGPGAALYLLPALIAELCCGATPPINYIFFGWSVTMLYGGGAVLIREAAFRWGKGWPTILALGFAYGIAEEGICCRTFFDITTSTSAGGSTYGWVGGVGWVFATHLSLYHAVISIAIPILFVSIAYRNRVSEPWVGRRGLTLSALGFLAINVIWLISYHVPVDGGYLLACLPVIAALVLVARRLPTRFPIPNANALARAAGARVPRPRRLALAGFGATFWAFTMDWGQGLGLSWPLAIAAMLGVAGWVAWWIGSCSLRPGWTDLHRFAAAAGVLCIFLPLAPLQEARGGRGMVLVGIALAVFLIVTWRRLGRANTTAGGAHPAAHEAAALAAG